MYPGHVHLRLPTHRGPTYYRRARTPAGPAADLRLTLSQSHITHCTLHTCEDITQASPHLQEELLAAHERLVTSAPADDIPAAGVCPCDAAEDPEAIKEL